MSPINPSISSHPIYQVRTPLPEVTNQEKGNATVGHEELHGNLDEDSNPVTELPTANTDLHVPDIDAAVITDHIPDVLPGVAGPKIQGDDDEQKTDDKEDGGGGDQESLPPTESHVTALPNPSVIDIASTPDNILKDKQEGGKIKIPTKSNLYTPTPSTLSTKTESTLKTKESPFKSNVIDNNKPQSTLNKPESPFKSNVIDMAKSSKSVIDDKKKESAQANKLSNAAGNITGKKH